MAAHPQWMKGDESWRTGAAPRGDDRHDALLARAGAGRANIALTLFDRLLVDGLIEVEERRDAQRGWQAHSLRFRDPVTLRRALGVPEPDAARTAWDERRSATFVHAELDIARAALNQLPPATSLTERDRTLLDQLCQQPLPPLLAALAAEMRALGEKGEQESLFW